MSQSPLLTLADVTLSLPGQDGMVDILRGISTSFAPAQATAITGPSGSGKTSLLMLCAGLLRPSAGAITLSGHQLANMNEEELGALRRQKLGIVFQNFHLIPTLTALENVAIALELDGAPDAFEKARSALADVGLGHRLTHYPSQLSGGEQQRVAIARALVRKPQLLLADEPTGNLDQATGAHIMELLFAAVRQSGAALLLITHDPQLAGACDRQLHMLDGKLAAAA
jgi:putative ABC transport system ATP-binding protein